MIARPLSVSASKSRWVHTSGLACRHWSWRPNLSELLAEVEYRMTSRLLKDEKISWLLLLCKRCVTFCRSAEPAGTCQPVRGMPAKQEAWQPYGKLFARNTPACQCTCPRVGQPTHRLVSWGDQVGSSAQGSGVTNVKLRALGWSKHTGNIDMGNDVASRWGYAQHSCTHAMSGGMAATQAVK